MTTSTTPSAWDEIAKQLEQIQKPVGTFKLCRDPEVRERYLNAQQADAAAQHELGQLPARGADPDLKAIVQRQAKDAAAELADAKQAYEQMTITLRFTALERKDLVALQKAHPPTEEDEANGQDQNLETFAPALISAASLDGMPLEAARQYMATWSPGDATDLWKAAWHIQHQKRTDLGKG